MPFFPVLTTSGEIDGFNDFFRVTAWRSVVVSTGKKGNDFMDGLNGTIAHRMRPCEVILLRCIDPAGCSWLNAF